MKYDTCTQRTVFDTPILSGAFRMVSRLALRLAGWTIEGHAPALNKYVLIAAPHTSNWDFPLAMAIAFELKIKLFWVGKASLFKGPFGFFMKWCGGLPVERGKKIGQVSQLAAEFGRHQQMVIAIAPEGTRKAVSGWKSGFYHIAREADVPLVLGFLDFRRKVGGLHTVFPLTGDYSSDLAGIQSFYRNICGKRAG